MNLRSTGESTTEARDILIVYSTAAQYINNQRATKPRSSFAEVDPRNVITEAVLLNAFQSGVSPLLIINIDSTKYCIPKEQVNMVVIKAQGEVDDLPATVAADSELDFAIKSHVLITASGFKIFLN